MFDKSLGQLNRQGEREGQRKSGHTSEEERVALFQSFYNLCHFETALYLNTLSGTRCQGIRVISSRFVLRLSLFTFCFCS